MIGVPLVVQFVKEPDLSWTATEPHTGIYGYGRSSTDALLDLEQELIRYRDHLAESRRSAKRYELHYLNILLDEDVFDPSGVPLA